MADALPRRRWLRRLVVTAALLGLVAAVLVWFVPVVVAKTALRQKLLDAALADLNGRATVADASFGWLSPVVLTGLTVTDRDGTTILTAESVTSSKTLLQLARDKRDLGTFTVSKPVASVACEPGSTNVERLFSNYLKDDGSAKSATRPAVRVVVVGGRAVLTEPGTAGEQVIDPVEATVTVPAARSEPVELEAKATAGGTLTVAAKIGEVPDGKLSAERFPLAAVGPAIRRFAAGVRADGLLTADLSGHGGPAAAVHGRAGVSGLSLDAPWLRGDTLRLASVELPLDVARSGNEVEVRKADLTCDVGTVSLSGKLPLDGTAEEYAGRAGLTAAADIDVAKLAVLVPHLFHLKPGTALTDGRLTANVRSVAAADGTRWTGDVRTTALRGTRDGKPLSWDQPLTAEFVARLGADKRPVFDKLVAVSDVAAVNARGGLDHFATAANLDLDKLAARLAEFADLGGWRLAGKATVQANGDTATGGKFAVGVRADLTGFHLTDPAGRGLAEPSAVVTLAARGLKAGETIRLEVGEVTVSAAGDELTAKLLEPVADLKTARTGRATAAVAGDLGRWRQRLAAFVALPADWQLAGAGRVAADATLADAGLTATIREGSFRDVRFRGAGLDLAEPTLTAAGVVTWERASGAVAVADARLDCPTATLTSPRLAIFPDPAGTVQVVGRLERLTGPLKLGTPVAGALAGPVTLDGKGGFAADLRADGFVYGDPRRPVWAEQWVTVKAAGNADANAVRFRQLAVAKDGAAADATGTLTNLSGPPVADLTGTLRYDLQRIEPQLRNYLGAGATVRGRGDKPFRLTGPLGGALDQLAGEATVGWDAVTAYGFDAGPGEVKGTLKAGKLDLSPVRASFGGGAVTLDPALDLTAADYPLSFAKGTVVDRAKLTPKAMAGALGYALPAVANAAQADGTVSFELHDNRIPLTDPDAAKIHGRLTIHEANLTAGPVFSQVLTLLDAKTTAVTLVKNQTVPVAVDKGRVYHDGLALTFGQTVVRSSGSVGLADQSLTMMLDLPVPPRAYEGPLKNNPRLVEAIRKQTIKVPVGGTLKQPRLDPKAFEASVAQIVRGAAKDAGRGFAEDFLKRGLGELEKKLDPKKP